MKQILSFLKKLHSNNNREWFNSHKEEYNAAKDEFEKIVTELILKIAEFDEVIKNVSVKECVFRIYRDIRFSHDKTPYKTHFGAYIAYPGGRKSQRGGYYLHCEPDGKSFFAAGVWSPQPPVLKALRKSIYFNYEEFDEIRNEKNFKRLFNNAFYEDEKLKKLPAGFSADFPDPEILKLKHYMVSRDFREEELDKEDFVGFVADLARQAYPLNQFLNFAIDELT